LADVFSISVLAFAMMNNFLHVLVHAASDSMARWADGEVAARWVRLFPVESRGHPLRPSVAGVGVHDSVVHDSVSATKPCNAVAPA